MDFTVIDFETANSKRASACALGIVKVRNGKVVEKDSWLIKPKDMKFNGMNIAIHGIRPEDVIDKEEFDILYEKIFKDKLKGELIVAHNASFDISVLRNTLDLYGIEYPELNYLCSVKVAQKTWPNLCNHKLNTVSDYLGFQFNHHDALDDCLASANVMVNAFNMNGCNSAENLVDSLNMQMGQLKKGGYTPCSINRRKK